MYTVYVLYSARFDKIYIGYSSSIEKRFLSHNSLGTKGWSRKYRPWELLYTEQYQTKGEALKREKQLKSGKGRNWIREIILNKP